MPNGDSSFLWGSLVSGFQAVLNSIYNTFDLTNRHIQISRNLIETTIVNEIDFGIDTLSILNNKNLSIIENAILDGVIDVAAANNVSTRALLVPISDSIQALDMSLLDVSNTFAGEFNTTRSLIGDVLDMLSGGLNTQITNNIIIPNEIFETVTSAMVEVVDRESGVVEIAIGAMKDSLKDLFDSTLDRLLKEAYDIVPGLEDIVRAILKGKDEAIEVGETATDDTEEGLGQKILASIFSKAPEGLELSADELLDAAVVHVTAGMDDECKTIVLDAVLREKEVKGSWAKTIQKILLSFTTIVIELSMLTSATAQSKLPGFLFCNPNLPMGPADTIASLQRGLIDGDLAMRRIREHGFYKEQANLIIKVGYQIPDLALVYAMWLRDELDDSGFEYSLKALGYETGFIEPLKKLAWFIPPAQDLIMMAVREVFDPEIVAKQGQDENFPVEFERWAAKQGISSDWAHKYWQAHWRLPSIQHGFEMLHRGVMTLDELKTLMRVLDVMPGYRDQLIQISYNPITRIDIRRMNAMDVFDEDQVNKAYHDIGYDDDNAAMLTAFTLELNRDDGALTLDVASDLTRSSILGFYNDGIIGKMTARALLIQAGINIAAAELYLTSADMDAERKLRKQDVSLIFDRFKLGLTTYTESFDAINGLSFESREKDLAQLDLERFRETETKLPSKADLGKFRAADIITDSDYVDQLERSGYPTIWAERYLQLAKGGATDANESG